MRRAGWNSCKPRDEPAGQSEIYSTSNRLRGSRESRFSQKSSWTSGPMSADVAYLDTSAAVKLLMTERESPALRRWLRRRPERASAALLRVELVRVVRRSGFPRLLPQTRRLLAGVHLIRLDDALLDRAADLDSSDLRSLDSIHLAAAASLGDDLAAVVTYDDRLLLAAGSLGLPTASPS